MFAKRSPQKIDVETLRPVTCVWELTLACNLRCGHCGSRAGRARPDELSTDECLGVVHSLAALGCEVITLSGGEPTLRPDWSTVARAIRDEGMVANIVTNGYALDRQLAQEMRASGLANVAVSVDGPVEIHDEIRGRGTFAKTVRSLDLLHEVGMSTTVMTTINKLNLNQLEQTYQVAVEHHADRWRTQLGKPMGNLQDRDEWVLAPRDLLRLLPVLSAIHERGPIPVGIGDSVGYYSPYDTPLRATSWKGKPQRWAGCQAGLRAIGIEADGGVKGCLSMQAFGGGDDPFLEGNLRRRSLESIWRDPRAFAYNRAFAPEALSGYCRGCRHRLDCRGGAKCVAAAATGALGEDPYCFYREAELVMARPRLASRVQAAATASLVGLLMHGCDLSLCDKTAAPEYGVEPPQCATIDCCSPDASVSAADLALCCGEAASCPEYGVEPVDCTAVDCCDLCTPISEAEAAQCCEAVACPEYGVEPCPEPVDCTEVCCECDYGVLPEGVHEQCCETQDPCADVCCDCDYGAQPPPECCPEDP